MTRWTLDPTHSSVEFAAKHMMLTTVKGTIPDVTGALAIDPAHRAGSHVEVTLGAASILTRSPERDAHLRSADFLDVERFPVITFVSSRVEGEWSAEGDRFAVVGDLTIHGVQREVRLEATFEGEGTDPWGNRRIAFHATTAIDRRDFGLTWNAALETGGVLVSHELKITLDVQATAAA